jgi:hypothetical protein
MSTSGQRPGDWKVVCDFSGMTCWASETVKTWNGYRVNRRFVGEETQRHPQEGQSPRVMEEGRVPWARPEPTWTFRDPSDVTPADL